MEMDTASKASIRFRIRAKAGARIKIGDEDGRRRLDFTFGFSRLLGFWSAFVGCGQPSGGGRRRTQEQFSNQWWSRTTARRLVLVDPNSNKLGSWSPIIDWTLLSRDGIEDRQSWLVSFGHGSLFAGHDLVSPTLPIVATELNSSSIPSHYVRLLDLSLSSRAQFMRM
ncbi:hypothetical protein CRG98_039500 [Punica granatum]|uniref:Uncharacterized protein n=1 Tax=Punica granatum TaxID=22663 RepID=A0A2I0I817_PUNGR|nr:hypothetical protein CRG98_039500 [Punica granatum]